MARIDPKSAEFKYGHLHKQQWAQTQILVIFTL